MTDFILHHYDPSPFSEKPRVMFGVKGATWRSVIQPVIMPKPELTPLTGGYRRIPVLQIGADVYCDSQVILAEIERRAPEPPVIRPADWAVNLTCDRLFFQATVIAVFAGANGIATPEFIADREKLSGRPFDIQAMQAAAPGAKTQWRGMAAWIEDGLERSEGEFLGGSSPSLADVALYMNVWWLNAANRQTAEDLLAGLPRTQAWRARIRSLGHGHRAEMTPTEALGVARASEPAPLPPHEAAQAIGMNPGEAVAAMADDYGRDPIRGRLAAATRDRVIIARDDPSIGRINVHLPRVGYHLTAG